LGGLVAETHGNRGKRRYFLRGMREKTLWERTRGRTNRLSGEVLEERPGISKRKKPEEANTNSQGVKDRDGFLEGEAALGGPVLNN